MRSFSAVNAHAMGIREMMSQRLHRLLDTNTGYYHLVHEHLQQFCA